MKVLFYSIHTFEMKFIAKANSKSIEISYSEKSLSEKTTALAKGFNAISIFTSDEANSEVLNKLSKIGIKYIAVRASGYDNIDLKAAERLGIKVANVPKYSPNAIAEHTIGLILALNRKILIANKQVHQFNFQIDNLIGFDLSNKTVGIIGTGNIGSVVIRILYSFGCKLIGFDIKTNKYLEKSFNLKYTSLENIYEESDIISIHTPLNKETKYLINKESLSLMKKKVMIINTSRGAIVNTKDLINFLQKGEIGCYGADVYEYEKDIFFNDISSKKIKDKLLVKLFSFENVLITPHQAFATIEALGKIAETNIGNLESWKNNQYCENEIKEMQ